MKPTVSLPSGDFPVELRLGAPVFTVGGSSASGELVGELRWRAQCGAATLEVAFEAQSPEFWRLRVHVQNCGEHRIEARVALPYLFYDFGTAQGRAFNPVFGGVLASTVIPIVTTYPGPASFCFNAATAPGAALCYGLFNAEQRLCTLRHVPAGSVGQMRLLLDCVSLEAGQQLGLPDGFVSVAREWAGAFAPYRDWLQSAFPRRKTRPQWLASGQFQEVRRAHCVAPMHVPPTHEADDGIWIFDDAGRSRSFEDVKMEVDGALEQGDNEGFVPLFYQFAWWGNMERFRGLFMFDSLCGDYTDAHELTRQVIRYIHERGAKVYLYTNVISAGDETQVFQHQPQLFVRDASGAPVPNASYPMFLFCPGAPGMRDYWDNTLRFILEELDADGVFLDQACGGTSPPLCRDPSHHHDRPDAYGRDFLALLEWIHDRARQIDPEAYIGGELFHDARGVILDECHGFGYSGPPAAPDESEMGTVPEYFVFSRFLSPQVWPSIGHLRGQNDVMDGAAGQNGLEIWRTHRAVFQAGARPCEVSPPSALAYLYGPKDSKSVLAVRAARECEWVCVELPNGEKYRCKAGRAPSFFVFEGNC